MWTRSSATVACWPPRPAPPPTVNDSYRYTKRSLNKAARNGVRRAAAELAMKQGSFVRARTHLEVLIHNGPADGELDDLLGQCQEELDEPGKAAASYRDAVAHAPGRIDAYTRLARLLRGPLNRPSQADQVMDDLVASNDHVPAAYLDRAAYRVAYGSLDDAEQDAARARELAPDDARVLLTTADLSARRGRAADARAALRRGLGLHPKDLGLRLALATLDLGTDRPDEAADCLEEGKKLLKVAEPAPDLSGLLNLLAEARLQQGRPGDVEGLAAEAREGGAIGMADYLDARLEMYRGRWETASRSLVNYTKTSAMSVDQGVYTLLCAAECYARLGDGDRRLAALRQAVGLAPFSASAGATLAEALLDAGRTDEALDELRGVTALPQAPEAAWALLARALLLHDQALPRDRRDWPEVDRALDRAGSSPETARLRAAALRRGRNRRGRPPCWNRTGPNTRIGPAPGRTWPSTRPAEGTRPGRLRSWRTPGAGSATGWNFGWPRCGRAPERKVKRPCKIWKRTSTASRRRSGRCSCAGWRRRITGSARRRKATAFVAYWPRRRRPI